MGKRASRAGKNKGRQLTERQRRYAVNRAKGMTKRNAVRRAGYKPKDGHAADNIAARNEASLRNRRDLEAALVTAGVSLERIAGVLSDKLRTPKEALRAVEVIGNWMGYQRNDHDPGPGQWDGVSQDDLFAARAILIGQIQRAGADAQAAAAGPGPAGPGARAATLAQSLAAGPPPPPGHHAPETIPPAA